MTKISPPSKAETKDLLPSELPTYTPDPQVSESSEKQDTPCHTHSQSSATPHLSTHLQQPSTQARLRELSTALADLADGTSCSRCATERATRTLTVYLRDLQAAKKSGGWSKEEKKAVKAEVKGFVKDLKRDVKVMWREK